MILSDKDIIENYLKNEYHLTPLRIEQEYNGLKRYPDLLSEFVFMIDKQKEPECMIEVEGFTAKVLEENYHLSLLGAYNYLIFLREKPIEALNYLKKGLPIK